MDRIKVIRGNRVIQVTENELERYLSKGYVIKDGAKLGSITTQPAPEKAEPKYNPLYKEVPEIKVETKVEEDTPKVKRTRKTRSKK